ncbi:uncharacterized protein BDV14DRAFT_42089 [Aspergillus stella-maris]|uniref:uncharacterized protein n=1 Tax=Aspergillus stella-maris TaxID=1810926 RepID=UPI003CCE20EE
MTTTSSFPSSNMEVPTMDDTMEMASPYQGHADDFDIDIDVMEDQASNPDRDMTAADEYMGNSHDVNHQHDGSPDEDMVDDEAEPSMVDADEYTETNPNVDTQYEIEQNNVEAKLYETEMLEDDYYEDIDAPVPDHEREAPSNVEHADNQDDSRVSPVEKEIPLGNNNVLVETQPEAEIEPQDEDLAELKLASEQTEGRVDSEKPIDEVETAHVEPPAVEETAKDINQADEQILQSEPHATFQDHQEIPEAAQKPEDPEVDDSNKPQPSNDGTEETELQPHQEGQQVPKSIGREIEQESDSTNNPPLHPVKVYYQQTEISLFPPKEGDSSETFFLEDENLAHQHFGDLFVACREVLQSHIVENEVLIVDIETLNFQLTEDLRETYNFTLKQIVDVYLQLCHNDSIEEPEALYLTLTTKRAAAEELSELMLAASEGKGLSEIQAWEVYPEGEDAAEYEEAAQESYSEEKEDALDHNGSADDLPHLEPEPVSHDQASSNPQQEGQEFRETQDAENADAVEHSLEAPNPEGQADASVDARSPHAASHNSEGQKTESSGTLEPFPLDEASEEQPESSEFVEHAFDGEEHEEEYHEEYHSDDEAHLEDGSFVRATGSNEDLGPPQADKFENSAEEHLEEHHNLEAESHEQTLSTEDKPVTPQDLEHESEAAQDDGVVDNDHDLQELEEPVPDPTIDEQSHQYQEVVHDSPNVAEGFSDPKHVADVPKEDTSGEVKPTEDVISLPAEGEDEADLSFEDEEDYLNLGYEEELGEFDQDTDAAPPSHVPGKRLREPEDGEDFPESTTPEVKRSRSS